MRALIVWFLNRVWYVHLPVVMLIQATPERCLQTLAAAARPSTQRLHLRSVFSDGRRYQFQPYAAGFRMTTTHKVSWHYRRRTNSVTILSGVLSGVGEDVTRIHLQVRIRIMYLLDAFLIPTLMASIILFVPWPLVIRAVVLAAMYVLSWVAHRYNARLEGHEMVYFVQKALEDFGPAKVAALAGSAPEVIYSGFEDEWQKFYQEHKDD